MTVEMTLFVLDARATPAWVVSTYFLRHNPLPVSHALTPKESVQNVGMLLTCRFYFRFAQRL